MNPNTSLKARVFRKPDLQILFCIVLFHIHFFAFDQIALGQTTERFTSPGNFTFTVPNYSGSDLKPGDEVLVDLEVIIVGAGGGGGKGNGAGGGGGGQVRTITIEALEGAVLTGSIGEGGTGRSGPNGAGANGQPTIFNGISSSGGIGGSGGNAGGGGNSGSGTSRGNGNRNGSRYAGGGGGGASGNGNNGTTSFPPPSARGGNGGAGINGYGGGGGGAANGGAGSNNVVGQGVDGGSNGSTGNASGASNGGGGGGGRLSGGNGGNGVVEINISFRILPVQYLYFEANFNSAERIGKLDWATAKEWENSHFEIERAQNGIDQWKKIGEVRAVGYSDQPEKYSFKDDKIPLSGGSLFYRIKQIDLNAKSTNLSEVVGLYVPSVRQTNGNWRVYPNPATVDNINIDHLNAESHNGKPITFRLVGNSINTPYKTVEDIESLNTELRESISTIRKGFLVIEIQWNNTVEILKVIFE